MNGWLYAWWALQFLALGRTLAKHGELETGEENAFAALVAIVISGGLLYMGGAFN
jgi:hypothetical protein